MAGSIFIPHNTYRYLKMDDLNKTMQKGQELQDRGTPGDIPGTGAEQGKTIFETTMKAVPTGIGLVDNRILVWVTERMTEMTGYSEEELIGKSSRILYESDEEFERVGKIKYAQIKEKAVGSIETRWRRKDGL